MTLMPTKVDIYSWAVLDYLEKLKSVFADDIPESVAITKLIESIDEPAKELHRLVGIEQKKYDESRTK